MIVSLAFIARNVTKRQNQRHNRIYHLPGSPCYISIELRYTKSIQVYFISESRYLRGTPMRNLYAYYYPALLVIDRSRIRLLLGVRRNSCRYIRLVSASLASNLPSAAIVSIGEGKVEMLFGSAFGRIVCIFPPNPLECQITR